jgi:hypothetical protein
VDRITLRAIALIAGTILVLLGVKPALDWLDLKLVVVSPSAAMPSGGTMVVSGGVGFQPIDSVEAFCKRCYASPTIWCKHRELDRLTRSGDVRFSLPFSETLFPDERRLHRGMAAEGSRAGTQRTPARRQHLAG